MTDFEAWCKNNIPDYRPEIDSEVICGLHVLETAYKAGHYSGFKEANTAIYDIAYETGYKAGLEAAAVMKCTGNY